MPDNAKFCLQCGAKKEEKMQEISIQADKLLNSNANRSQDQEKFNEEYKKLEQEHTKVKNEAEALEKEIEYKTARKNKLTCVIKAYKLKYYYYRVLGRLVEWTA